MRVLIAHSRYMTGSVSGENRVVEDEARLLRDAGHDVAVYAPEPVHPDRQGRLDLLRSGAGVVWSGSAVRAVEAMIRRDRPDVVHLHNLIPMLSPAVIRAIDRAGIPAVMTLHNYRLLCLPATLERDGSVCERCLGHLPWQGVRFGCYRGSVPASAAVATSLGLHRALGTFSRLRLLLPVSAFVRDVHRRAGWDAGRMSVKRNFAWPAARREGEGEYFLYAGRLAREKGVEVLVRAWRPSIGRLLIAGTGPEEARLRGLAPEGIEFLGPLRPDALAALVGGARAVVVPSMWFETSGRIVLEAAAAGVPAIASRIGALPEAVEDGESGVLAAPGEPEAWGDAMASLSSERARTLGEGAHRVWRERYAPERALDELEQVYRRVSS